MSYLAAAPHLRSMVAAFRSGLFVIMVRLGGRFSMSSSWKRGLSRGLQDVSVGASKYLQAQRDRDEWDSEETKQ